MPLLSEVLLFHWEVRSVLPPLETGQTYGCGRSDALRHKNIIKKKSVQLPLGFLGLLSLGTSSILWGRPSHRERPCVDLADSLRWGLQGQPQPPDVQVRKPCWDLQYQPLCDGSHMGDPEWGLPSSAQLDLRSRREKRKCFVAVVVASYYSWGCLLTQWK